MKDSGSIDCQKIKNVEDPRVEKICEKIHKRHVGYKFP